MRTRRLGRDPQLQKAAARNPLLSIGASGSGVAQIQDLLASIGFKLPRSMKKTGADGKFGPETQNAVKEFQRSRGLKADGIVGPKTIELLEQTIEQNPFLEAPDATQDAAAAQFDVAAPVSQKRNVYT
jgi:peptidoglycan hydrolase-like protein with peptidoglycan-binding domain